MKQDPTERGGRPPLVDTLDYDPTPPEPEAASPGTRARPLGPSVRRPSLKCANICSVTDSYAAFGEQVRADAPQASGPLYSGCGRHEVSSQQARKKGN